jgi:hypothetical protein
MTETIWFTLTGAVLYLAADRLLDAAERRAGKRFQYRSVIFFVLLFSMAAISFALIRQYTG